MRRCIFLRQISYFFEVQGETFIAHPQHVLKLLEGVKSWNKWRQENPEIGPNLHKLNLSPDKFRESPLWNQETKMTAWSVMAEVTVGYIMLGGLIAIFSNKLARRA